MNMIFGWEDFMKPVYERWFLQEEIQIHCFLYGALDSFLSLSVNEIIKQSACEHRISVHDLKHKIVWCRKQL